MALCAAAMGLLSWYELTNTWWNAPLFFFTIGSTLVVYNLNMITGLAELRRIGTDSERHHWCMKNEKAMKATLVIGLAMAAGSVWFLNQVIWLFMIPLATIALVYTVPILKKQAKHIRLREIGLWKIFIIAIVWVGMTVILPAIEHEGIHQLSNLKSWWLAVERGIFILAITLPFDIRDMLNDEKKSVRTIPSTIGTFRSVLLAEILLGLFMFLVWWRLGADHELFWSYSIASLITMIGVSYATPQRNDMYCSFWIEGTMMLMFFSVLVSVQVS